MAQETFIGTVLQGFLAVGKKLQKTNNRVALYQVIFDFFGSTAPGASVITIRFVQTRCCRSKSL